MYHPIPRLWLEATNRIDVRFDNGAETKHVSGSGFWLAIEPTMKVVFITNRHVVDMAYKCKKYIGEGYQPSRLTVSSHGSDPYHQGVVADLERDIDIRVHSSYGVDIAIVTKWEYRREHPLVIRASKLLADQSYLDGLPWGAQVSFASFQAWRDSNTQKPILRTGIVSSDPRDDYVSDMVDRKSALLLEAFSFSGSSGSPLIANAFGLQLEPGTLSGGPGFREARIIGIMCGHIPNREDRAVASSMHVGLSYCHKSTMLLEMLSQFDTLERLPVVNPPAQLGI